MDKEIAIRIENLSKQYRLGVVGTGTLSHDLKRWWAINVLKKEDPYLKIGEKNTQEKKGQSDYVWALRDINLEIKKGDIVGIIGKNGAGKSTLLKILSRVTKPTTGLIHYEGSIASLLEVGTGFHPEMTGKENIFMNGSIMGMTRLEIAKKLDEIVDFAGIERYLDTPVKRYSSGMTVRLGFSIAAHLEPDILVVDEVLAVGDAEFQKKAIGKMQDVSKEFGRTVLFVSHNMQAVKMLCNRGILLNNGEIFLTGTSQSIVDKYGLINISNNDNNCPIKDIQRPSNISLEAKIIGISVINGDLGDQNIIDPLRPITIKVIIEAYSDNVRFGTQFIISDINQNIIMFDSASFHHKIYNINKGSYEIICNIEPINLFAGSYHLQAVLTLPNQGLVDHVENAYEFTIGNLDPYLTGNNLHKENGFAIYHVKHDWSEAIPTKY